METCMSKSITPLQERDTCLAVSFLLLLIWLFTHQPIWIYIAMCLMLPGMIWPRAFHPVAVVWFGIAKIMGHFMSAILLTIIWTVMVLPVGFIRRLAGRDALNLKQWHNGAASCFVKRDHTYTPEDLKHPY